MGTKINISNHCRILQNIILTHDYYTFSACPATLVPNAETLGIMKQYCLQLKTVSANRWLLLSQGNFRMEDLSKDNLLLHFTLKADNNLLHYVSEKNWDKIEVPVNGSDTTIRIACLEKYLEYICIPKYSASDLPVKMTEAKNRLHFKEAERIALPDIPVALRFVSEEKIQLMQQNEFKAQLWEIRENGERLAGEALSIPQPNRFSPVSPQDTITSYLYY